MKWTEIINEWKLIDDIKFEMPDFTNGENFGYIKTTTRDYQIKRIVANSPKGEEICFGVEEDNNIVGFLGILVLEYPYAIAKNAQCSRPMNGIISALFNFVIRDLGFKLMSDFEMTQNGVDLWKSLIKKYNTSIVDLKYMIAHDTNEIGQKNEYDEIILSPEQDDRWAPINLNNINSLTDQRYLYLIEHNFSFYYEKANRYIMEGKTKSVIDENAKLATVARKLNITSLKPYDPYENAKMDKFIGKIREYDIGMP
jgi:hypothetical protein